MTRPARIDAAEQTPRARRVPPRTWAFVTSCCVLFAFASPAPAVDFRRGDANADGQVLGDDAAQVLSYLFLRGELSCRDAADSDDDGRISVADPIYTLLFVFNEREAPPPPFADCGPDPSEDLLDCLAFEACGDAAPLAPDLLIVLDDSVVPETVDGERVERESRRISARFFRGGGGTSPACETAMEVVDGFVLKQSDCTLRPVPIEGGAVSGYRSGAPGVVRNGAGAEVELVPLPPALPFADFAFVPAAGSDLMELGIGPGENVTVSFPGGEDLEPFACFVAWPPRISGLRLPHREFRLDASEDFTLTWEPAAQYEGALLITLARRIELEGPRVISTVVELEILDAAGTVTIPGSVLGRFAAVPRDALSASDTLTLRRTVRDDSQVPLTGGMGHATIRAQASSTYSTSRELLVEPSARGTLPPAAGDPELSPAAGAE